MKSKLWRSRLRIVIPTTFQLARQVTKSDHQGQEKSLTLSGRSHKGNHKRMNMERNLIPLSSNHPTEQHCSWQWSIFICTIRKHGQNHKESLTCWSRVETPGSDSWVPCPLSPVWWCLWDSQPFQDQLLYLRIWNNDNIHFVRLLWWLALSQWDIISTGMPVEDSLYHINWYKSHLKCGEDHSLILGHLRKREGADH